ncbi:aminopeptidase [Sporosarcina sp. FSL K6-3457]|uniref:aminopeptidase n=2 Tax=Sporosarcina sp. FSL K6-3457 TaxID=2978204 RepID=UPI0030F4B62F
MDKVNLEKGGVHLRIHNIITDFLDMYESKKDLRILDLETYIDENAEVFDHYFPIHCPKTPERLQEAIEKYPMKIKDIYIMSERLPRIIKEIDEVYTEIFHNDLDINYTMLVGTYGSNAFVTREIKGDIYFAVEKLSSEIDHLKAITAHEIGHVTHFSFAARQGMDWTTVDWTHGLTTLYTEGAATYLSKKVVPGLNESVYFTYDKDGDSWVTCYQENKTEVKRRFFEDVLSGWNTEKEKEWFRLSGGGYFGHNRLGYLLGTDYVEHLVNVIGEEAALAFWSGNDVKKDILTWLEK